MKKSIVFLMVSLLFGFNDAQAFWSKGQTVHQDITKAALGKAYSIGDAHSHSFSSRAIDSVNNAHWQQDSPANEYNRLDHFDSESFTDSYLLLSVRRLQLETELAKKTPDKTLVWTLLGQMLHSTQDFYAHSSWVANGNFGIVDFGSAMSAGVSPPAIKTAASIGEVCADGINLSANKAITTGYYKLPLPSGKCQHGSVYHAAFNCAALLLVDGISHDHSCFTSPVDLAIHAEAKKRAQLESESIVTSIIKDLSKSGNVFGICVMLDIEKAFPQECQAQVQILTASCAPVDTRSGPVIIIETTLNGSGSVIGPVGSSFSLFATTSGPIINPGDTFSAGPILQTFDCGSWTFSRPDGINNICTRGLNQPESSTWSFSSKTTRTPFFYYFPVVREVLVNPGVRATCG